MSPSSPSLSPAPSQAMLSPSQSVPSEAATPRSALARLSLNATPCAATTLAKALAKEQSGSPAACAICLSPVPADPDVEYHSECCGNRFHRKCLTRHKGFKSEHARCCPLCRSKAHTGLTPGLRRPAVQAPVVYFRTAAEERTRRELGIPEDEPVRT